LQGVATTIGNSGQAAGASAPLSGKRHEKKQNGRQSEEVSISVSPGHDPFFARVRELAALGRYAP